MAIKISGTTVIDDSRQLTNIASVDATTVAALGSAGIGGGGTYEFTASSAISSGQAVALQSNGEVAPITSTIGTLTNTTTPVNLRGYEQHNEIGYQPTVDAMLATLRDSNTGHLYYNILKRNSSGEIVSQGDGVIASSSTEYHGLAYNPNIDAFAVVTTTGGNNITAYVTYVTSSFTIQIPRSVNISTIGNWTAGDVCYDSSLDKFVAVFGRGSDTWVFLLDYGPSPNYTISVTASLQLNLGKTMRAFKVATDNNGQFVIVGGNTTDGNVSVMTFSISGSTITAGSVTQVYTSNVGSILGRTDVVYDSDTDSFLVGYYFNSGGTSDWIYMRTVTVSNNTATVGSSQPLISFGTSVGGGSLAFANDSLAGITAFYGNNSTTFDAKEVTITNTGSGATGLTISTGSAINLSQDSTSFPSHNYKLNVASTGDDLSGTIHYALIYANSNGILTEAANKTFTSDNTNFIGFATSSISTGASGDITHIGGVNENQTGLTANTTYYVGLNGTLQTTDSGVLAGKALSATKLLVKG